MNIYHLISNKVWGGGEQYVLDLAQHQREDGHYVEIVCRRVPEVIAPFQRAEFPISTLPLKGITDVDSAMRLSRVIKRQKNVIIHTHNFKDSFTANMARKLSENRDVKVVISRHLVKRGKRGLLYNSLYKDIDKIIFVSQIAKEGFLESNPKIDGDKLAVVHNGVMPKSDSCVDLHAKYGISADKKILMYHGRLSREKGIDVLLRALCLIDKSKYHMVLCGAGETRYVNELNMLVEVNSLSNNVTFAGFTDYPQDYIAGCDIGVMPSVARESLCLSNLEYMMMGKPVITTNNGAQPEYIDDGINGILVPPGDKSALALAINNLIDSPEYAEGIGTAAKRKFEAKLDYNNFYKKISKIYNEL